MILGDRPNFSGTTRGGPARKNGALFPLRLLILSACGLPLFLASAGFAQTIDLSLNVFYSTPSDVTSGGTWQLVGKSTDFGIAGISANVNNIATAQDSGREARLMAVIRPVLEAFSSAPMSATATLSWAKFH